MKLSDSNTVSDQYSLLKQAELCMEQGPWSVTDKPALEFSTDPHDYVSGRLYWWKEGDQYIRKDGEPNPATRGPNFDRQRLEDFITAVMTLVLAFQQSGRKEFAQRATDYINAWFLDAKTAMNPHLEYAQLIPGKKSDGFGIIDTYDFYYLLDAVELLQTEGFIDSEMRSGLNQWFHQLCHWLTNSRQGKREAKRKNNHGTSYDVQLIRYLLFSGQRFKAMWRLWRAKSRVNYQIDHTGAQPFEQERTKSLFYHWYNLGKLIHLCELGQRTGINLIDYRGKIKAAINYVAPYIQQPEQWPVEQIALPERCDIAEVIYIGAEVFKNELCQQNLQQDNKLLTEPRYLWGKFSFNKLLHT